MSGAVELAAAVLPVSGRVYAGVAARDGAGFRVLSRVSVPSCPLSDGVPTDFPAFSEAVGAAVSEAASSAGAEVFSAAVGVGGTHVKGVVARGAVYLGSSSRPVTPEDVSAALEAARDIQLPSDRVVLDMLPCAYAVDEARGLGNPVGLEGLRLECEALAVTCTAASPAAYRRALSAAALKPELFTSAAWAGAAPLLTAAEQNSRTLVIDVAADCTDLLLLRNSGPRMLVALPHGFGALVAAASRRFNLPPDSAERLLASTPLKVGDSDDFLLERGSELEVPPSEGFDGGLLSRGEVWDLATDFFAELFESTAKTLALRDLVSEADSIVLAGAAARAEGIEKMALSRLNAPARRVPVAEDLLHHRLDGLLMLTLRRRSLARAKAVPEKPTGLLGRITRFFSDIF